MRWLWSDDAMEPDDPRMAPPSADAITGVDARTAGVIAAAIAIVDEWDSFVGRDDADGHWSTQRVGVKVIDLDNALHDLHPSRRGGWS